MTEDMESEEMGRIKPKNNSKLSNDYHRRTKETLATSGGMGSREEISSVVGHTEAMDNADANTSIKRNYDKFDYD